MTIPLQIGKGYIPIDIREGRSRKPKLTVTNELETESNITKKRKTRGKGRHKTAKSEAAKKLGMAHNIFMNKTKKNRAIGLLGKGDFYKGYLRYEEIAVKTREAFFDMCDILERTPKGYITFDRFRGDAHSSTTDIKGTLNRHKSIKQYNSLIRIHSVLKAFQHMEHIKENSLWVFPAKERTPLNRNFLKEHYWEKKLTTKQIAKHLIVPEHYVELEIKRLGMGKRENGIKFKGKRGFKMPEEQKVKHQNQPHARAVVQICPATFKVLREFNSTGAVEREGWGRENVRKAIKSVGLHDGFLWAYKGEHEAMIAAAKAKGDLEDKLRQRGLSIDLDSFKELYHNLDLTVEQIAEKLGCSPGTVPQYAHRFGIKRRPTRKVVSIERLKFLYLDKGLSAKQISQTTGHTAKTISTYLSRYKISKKVKTA